ncbi:MAG: hypothetical protein E7505_06180 [Ruminococcus sp.]|nr:hypothetical protein [Ruminococcus sp.]
MAKIIPAKNDIVFKILFSSNKDILRAFLYDVLSFSILEDKRYERLTDKLSMHFFELKKLNQSMAENDRIQQWMRLINAESEEEFSMLQQTNNPAIQDGIRVIYELSEDEKVREMIRQREKAERDYNSGMADARAEGRIEGEQIGLARGEQIGLAKAAEQMRRSGLSEEQIKSILSQC